MDRCNLSAGPNSNIFPSCDIEQNDFSFVKSCNKLAEAAWFMRAELLEGVRCTVVV